VTEILSGKALNDVLADLRGLDFTSDPAGPYAFPLPLDEEGLKHVNVTTGAGNIALLKNEGRLNWPLALSGMEFEVERDRLAARALTAVRQAEFNNQVDASTIQQMTADVDTLDQQLQRNGRELPAMRYIEGKTFLHNFADAIKALAQENVGNHFNGNYALKAQTVSELVGQMTKRRLRFAPALPGDEAAYVVLRQALATYALAAHPRVTAR
jgi:hypothetical protein